MPMHRRRAWWWSGAIALALCVSACGGFDRDEYLPSSPSFADALVLTVESTTIPADGFSTTRITAAISPNADPARRTIAFTATKGTFAGTGDGSVATETSTIDSTVDSTGRTTVLLRSTTTVQTVTVSAVVKDVDGLAKQVLVNFAAVNADDVLLLSATTTDLPADGFSRTRLTAVVKTLANPADRRVVFKTSKGTLISSEAATANGTSVEVPTDGSGVASVELQSSLTVEPAFVSATAAGVTKSLTVRFVPPDPDSIIQLSAATSSAPADGATRVQITAQIAGGIPSGSRAVTFSAGGGSFASNTTTDQRNASVTPDGGNRAIIDLVAPLTAQAVRVTATVNGVSASTVVMFTAAPPDRIFVSPASAVVGPAADNVISVSLLRDVGVAAANQVVTYTARDANGNSVGSFSDVQLSSHNAGQTLAVSSATYNHAGGAAGPVTIEVSAGGVTGQAVIRIQ